MLSIERFSEAAVRRSLIGGVEEPDLPNRPVSRHAWSRRSPKTKTYCLKRNLLCVASQTADMSPFQKTAPHRGEIPALSEGFLNSMLEFYTRSFDDEG